MNRLATGGATCHWPLATCWKPLTPALSRSTGRGSNGHASRAALCLLACWLAVAGVSCDRSDSGGGGGTASTGGGKKPVIGVSFDTLQTEYWVASRDAIEAGIKKRGGEMLLAVANNDANRQLEQVNNF